MGGKKGRPKNAQPIGTIMRGNFNPYHGRKLSHPHPSNVACM
jgi:hypothetical protein